MLCRRSFHYAAAAFGARRTLGVAYRTSLTVAVATTTAQAAAYSTTAPCLRLSCTRPVLEESRVPTEQQKQQPGNPSVPRKPDDNKTNVQETRISKEYGLDEGANEGFHEDAIVVKDEKGNSITRVRRLPLTLIEEVPLPQRILTEIELVMMAWSEEHARRFHFIVMLIRVSAFVLVAIVLYVFYRTQISSERVLRGVDNIPKDLKIGNVVYFDMTEDGVDIGRIVIGLLTENCPLYCEYFHRRCTGDGGSGDSFRGQRLAAMVPRHCLIFGDGREMVHDVAGFNPSYLPTEHLSDGAWRGALSSIAYGPDRESPNFIIHVSSGDYKPQVFALVLGGYNVVERINQAGTKHGNAPKREFIIEDCGELCTLAKSHITPMPWKLYESISRGYDEEKFGSRAPDELLRDSDARGAALYAKMHAAGDVAVTEEEGKKRKRFWIF